MVTCELAAAERGRCTVGITGRPAAPSVTLEYVAGGRGVALVGEESTRSVASGPEVSFSGQKSSGEDPMTEPV